MSLPNRLGPPLVLAALLVSTDTSSRAQPALDYCPLQSEVVLNTDFTYVQPVTGPPVAVTGGVFMFRHVTIKSGVTVRGTGSKPMVWIVSGDFVVHGQLSVDGEDGVRVATLNNASIPTAAGLGACSGGNGGEGSPNTTGQSATGEAGFGPGQLIAFGGGPGRLGVASCARGSGGGGGSFATAGDPHYEVKAVSPSLVQTAGTEARTVGAWFLQQRGIGGFGCTGPGGSANRTLRGGAAGSSVFVDSLPENNFFGVGFNVHQGALVPGELMAPLGGSGGGGGGDRTVQLGAPNWISDNKGGGGGGGGGVLIVQAMGKILVSGRISADGGHGGGGEQSGGNNQGGGGGGGSGGMLILESRDEIVLHQKGETYANRDYDFSLSADGGVGTQGTFGGVLIAGKYPPPPTAAAWGRNPTGGFGGMGVVQLAAPMGTSGTSIDGTNTILDDHITILDAMGQPLIGREKTRFLGWRGYPGPTAFSGPDHPQRRWVDDFGRPTYFNDPATPGYPDWATGPDDEGDIRPAPVLLPSR